jgi:head-tail adaptor
MSGPLAGMLNERIHIESPSSERNAMGLLQPGWTTSARCRAAVIAEGVGSESEGMTLSAMPRFRVIIRARRGLSIDQRIKWKERILMIRQINDDPRLKDRITLRCEEVRR